MPYLDFRRKYNELVKKIDAQIKDTVSLHQNQLRCAPGCSSCCTISSVLPLEAYLLREAVNMLEKERQMQLAASNSSCPLLIEGLCSIYQNRPIICRTHGLPIAYVDYERLSIDVSACTINFPEGYCFEQEELFYMDSFNGELAVINKEFCKELGLNPAERISMWSLVGDHSARRGEGE